MPDLGLTKAIGRAVRAGVKDIKGVRPGTPKTFKEALIPEKPVAPAAAPTLAPVEVDPIPAVKLDDPPIPPPAPAAAPTMDVPPAVETQTNVDAFGLSKAKLEDFKLDESYQPNFDVMKTTDDVKAAVADVAVRNKDKITEARRGVITNEALQGLADDLDVNTDVVKKIMERESGGVLNAETILAARQVLHSSADRLSTLAKKITAGQATDMERIQFRRQMQWHAEYQTQFMGARAESGRALNAFGIPTGTLDGDQIARLKEVVEGMHGNDTDQLAKVIAMTDNVPAINKLARKYTQSKLMGVVNENFINSILSGPVTHLVNGVGNVLFQGMNIAERAVAARLGRFLSGDEHVMVGEATSLLHGTLGAVGDGLKLAAKTARTGVSLDDVVKFEGGSRRSISAKNLLPPAWQDTPLGRVVDGLGAFVRLPTERVMAPTDELFKTLAYRAELERQAYLHAYSQVSSGAVQTQDAERIAREFMENVPLDAQKAADKYAQYVTFQNPLSDKMRMVQAALRGYPVLSLIAPFIRTPVNIFKAGVERSPVALFTRDFRAALKRGGQDRDMALARVGMGSATAALIVSWVMDGRVTGAGPSDPAARQLLMKSGWRPYSIKVGDTYHSYARLEPLASVIGATADAAEIGSNIEFDPNGLKDEDVQVNDMAAAIIAGIANNTMSKTFTKGLADFAELMSDPKRFIANYAKEMGAAQIPYSALRRQVAATQDPYLREAWTLSEKIRAESGIPGYSEDAPPRRDVYGKPILRKTGELLGSMSVIPSAEEDKSDRITQELIKVMDLSRMVPVNMPDKKIEGMRLTTGEYDKYVEIARSKPIFAGRTFRDLLQQTIDSSVYQTATPTGRAELLKHVQQRADKLGRELLEKESPAFAARMAAFRAKKDRLRFGQ